MSYQLRLIESSKEVITSTVGYIMGSYNYPSVGQTIDNTWKVISIISRSETELWLRVERV